MYAKTGITGQVPKQPGILLTAAALATPMVLVYSVLLAGFPR